MSRRRAAVRPQSTGLVTVAGVPLQVRRSGAGRPLLLLNGLGCSVETWQSLGQHLEGFETLAFDPPGIGQSPAARWPLTIGRIARLARGVADQAGWTRFDVLGLSWGGTVAQQLAHEEPARVRNLVLCATTFGPGSFSIDPVAIGLMAVPWRPRSTAYSRAAAAYLLGPDVDLYPEAYAAFLSSWRPPTLHGFYSQVLAASTWSSLPWLRRLRQRTLVMAGRHDRLVPLFTQRLLARAIPEAQLDLSDGGHLFLLLRARESAALIRQFLGSENAGAYQTG